MEQPQRIRLGVNIDHVATLRQARRTTYPSLVEAVAACERGGAEGGTGALARAALGGRGARPSIFRQAHTGLWTRDPGLARSVTQWSTSAI